MLLARQNAIRYTWVKMNENCPQLQVHGTPMKTVFSDVYLGDEISADGTNKLNIQRRVMKGNGMMNQIMTMLEWQALFQDSIIAKGQYFP